MISASGYQSRRIDRTARNMKVTSTSKRTGGMQPLQIGNQTVQERGISPVSINVMAHPCESLGRAAQLSFMQFWSRNNSTRRTKFFFFEVQLHRLRVGATASSLRPWFMWMRLVWRRGANHPEEVSRKMRRMFCRDRAVQIGNQGCDVEGRRGKRSLERDRPGR